MNTEFVPGFFLSGQSKGGYSNADSEFFYAISLGRG